MKIDQEQYDDVTLITPQGAIIGDDAEQLAAVLATVLEGNPQNVMLDMSNVPQIDSTGLETLAVATEQLIRTGRVLNLAVVDETISEILTLTGLASLFEYSDSVERPVKSVL